MAQEPFPLPFKVQKEHKGIFSNFYLQTFISIAETKIKVKTASLSKVQPPPSNPVCPNTSNVANHQKIKNKKNLFSSS